jgi:uncharacterized membrane protein YgcG
MLVLLAIKERMYYISVGRGFEALFPNNRVHVIGSAMIPDLRQRHYSEAVVRSTNEIASIIAQERGITLDALAPKASTASR